MGFLYDLLLTLTSPIWATWMFIRTRRRKEQPNWKERTGDYTLPKPTKPRVWLHAVSVGEVVAAMPILRELRQRHPKHEIVLSVTTSSGHQTARERAADLFDHLVYMPIDLKRFQLNAMQRVRPQIVAIMETELWFNFLWAAKVFDAKTLLINGRISDRAFPRSQKLAFFYRPLLAQMDRCLMQSDVDAERIRALGAQSAEVLGNCKFDQALEGLDADPAEWRAKLGIPAEAKVLVVGSTRGDVEPTFVLNALRQVAEKDLWVVHAPRHLETADALEAEAQKALGGAARRSRNETGRYLILDTYGELSQVYAVADVVVIGGGFDNLGGQNLLQPLAHGKPVLHGPHMQNFRDVAAMATAAGASEVCRTPEELAAALVRLLADPAERQKRGEAARTLVRANVGASARYAEAIAAAAKE